MEYKASQQQLPSIYLIPARSPRDLRSVAPSLAFGGPGESNSAVVVFLSPRDVTDPSQSPQLHRLRDGTVSSSFIEFTVGDGAWPKYAKDSP